MTVALALEDPAAVASLAPATPASIEVATGPGPNTGSFRARIHTEIPSLASIKSPAPAGYGCSPNCVWAIVSNLKCGCIGGGGDKKGDEKRENDNEIVEEAHAGRGKK